MQKSFLIPLSVLAVAVATTVVQAKERYAILVGVGHYPHLREKLQLNGPPNDVRLMREYLTKVEKFSKDNVLSLTDGGAQLPRHAEIRAALDTLGKKLAAGDFALLYFAGHGSRQPDEPGADEESDGYDEIFLPRDVRGWSKAIGKVENAIVDDEIGEFIRTYRRKGADIWVIFDSCHSGTMTRGVGDESMRTRKVSPKDLGIPDELSEERAPRSRGQLSGDSNASTFTDISTDSSVPNLGALIQFFASHSHEETPEKPLPFPLDATASNKDTLGLFTYSIVQALSRFPDVSYDALAQMVIAHYRTISHNSSTPQFYGTNMSRRVFGSNIEHNLAFRATLNSELNALIAEGAGRLRGFDVGATVSIHPIAADTSTIGTGIVTQAMLAESTIEPNWKESAAVPDKDWKPVHVRLIQPSYNPTVRIAEIETAREADNRRLRDIIGELKKDKIPLIEFVGYDSDAYYFAAFFGGKFWLLQPGQTLPCSVQVITEEERRKCERYLFCHTYLTKIGNRFTFG